VGGLSELTWSNPLWSNPLDVASFQCLIFESLLALDPQDGHLLPRLAEKWTLSPDGETITFTLRGGVRWHDGQSFSAEDVIFTWRAVMSATVPIPHAESVAWVSKIETPEKRVVTLHLRQPNCAALTQLGLLPILPAHLWKASEVTQPLARPALMVGTGPFRLTDWETSEAVTLTRYADYWAGKPYLEGWAYKRYDTPSALLAAAQAGEIDMFPTVPPLSLSQELRVRFRPLTLPTGESLFLLFNQACPALSESDIRRALALALNRKKIASQVGGAELVTSIMPPHHWSLPPDLQPPPFDPAEARRLLASRDRPLSLAVTVQGGDRLREDVALLVAQDYRQVGIEARVEVLDWGLFLGDLFHHNFDVALLTWPFPHDPDQTFLWHSREITPGVGFNFGSYVSPQADRLLDAGRTAEGCSEATRAPFYHQLARLLAQDQPADFLLAPQQMLALNRRVRGLAPSPFSGLYWNVTRWWMHEGP